MASWEVTTRNVNKGVAQLLVVRYSHPNAAVKNEDWFVPVGFSLGPALLKNQRVVGDSTASKVNEAIQRVVSRLKRTVRAAGSRCSPLLSRATPTSPWSRSALPLLLCWVA